MVIFVGTQLFYGISITYAAYPLLLRVAIIASLDEIGYCASFGIELFLLATFIQTKSTFITSCSNKEPALVSVRVGLDK